MCTSLTCDPSLADPPVSTVAPLPQRFASPRSDSHRCEILSKSQSTRYAVTVNLLYPLPLCTPPPPHPHPHPRPLLSARPLSTKTEQIPSFASASWSAMVILHKLLLPFTSGSHWSFNVPGSSNKSKSSSSLPAGDGSGTSGVLLSFLGINGAPRYPGG